MSLPSTLTPPKCRDCSGPTSLRTGKFGPFWGCNRFPVCRGITNLSAKERKLLESRDNTDQPATPATPSIYPSNYPSKSKQSGFNLTTTSAIDPPSIVKPSLDLSTPTNGNLKLAYVAFSKHNADELHTRINNPNPKLFTGSPQQLAVWRELDRIFDPNTNPTTLPHVVVDARAGTGKTSLLEQWLHLAHLAHRPVHAQASSTHSLGYSMVRRAMAGTNVKFRRYKLYDIVDTICAIAKDNQESTRIKSAVRKVVSMCKNILSYGNSGDIDHIIDNFQIDLPKSYEQEIYQAVPKILDECKRQTDAVDYDDMLWLPCINNWGLGDAGFSIMFIDEFQDTNLVQQRLTYLACPTGRIVVIGDRFQSIFGFRGSDLDTMDKFRASMAATTRNSVSYPLSVTRRCPKLVVKLAQYLVPDITALDDAPDGVIDNISYKQAVKLMIPGDMVGCRINRTIIPCAYALIKRGVKAIVRGRDIGDGLSSWITKLNSDGTIVDLLTKAEQFYNKEAENLIALGPKGENRLTALQDRHDCLVELCEGMDNVDAVLTRINELFADFDSNGLPINAVLLGTWHRLKGLEANHVWVLNPELLPHPKSTGWQREQDLNILYVAITRTKFTKGVSDGHLTFIGITPPVLLGRGSQDDDYYASDDDYDDTRYTTGVETSLPDNYLPTQDDINDAKADVYERGTQPRLNLSAQDRQHKVITDEQIPF